MKYDFYIRTKDDLIRAVNDLGFVPFFRNSIEGFSIEEHIDPKLWFGDEEGPWEWKGPVIRETGCAYGKFFEKKAVYISSEWFPDFANYRRDGYDFDARFDDELASYQDKRLFDLVDTNAPILSKNLKQLGNYRKGGNKGFDTVITRLQAECYVIISNFTYLTDKRGQEYGWGVAEYSTPERFMGSEFTQRVYQRTPEESYERIYDHLKKMLPNASEAKLKKVL
ncbi:MAG: hypothetical protein J1F18_01495 [Lachnospiraceae bacterium]|nr:hypothetical protein [Lachnospiraceae bacterium]